jgi:hypothetical protein
MNRAGKQNLAVAGLSLGVFALVILLLSTAQNGPQSSYQEKTSSFFTDSSGTKAIFLVLQEFLPSAKRWMKPLHLLPPPERSNATNLLIIGPTDPLDPAEAEALDRWIARGGQLILALQRPWHILEQEAEQRPEPESFLLRHGFSFASAEDVVSAFKEYDNPIGGLLLGGSALRAGEFTELFSDQLYIKGAEKQLGSGRIVVIADRQAWSNDRLAESRNAVWLVSTVSSWGNGRLLIDEYHHGFQSSRGPVSLILSFITSFWGLVFVQLAVAGLLLIWLRGRRFGPVIDLPARRRQDPLRRMESLATLLTTAKATSFALQSVHQLLLRRLWQLRFGTLSVRPHTKMERQIGKNVFSADYRSLLRRQEEGKAPSEEELLRAAREAGKIIQEYKSGR